MFLFFIVMEALAAGIVLLFWERKDIFTSLDICSDELKEIHYSIISLNKYIKSLEKEIDEAHKKNKIL